MTDAFTATVLDAPRSTPPWSADHFQVQKYGTRYYADPLPPCELIADPHAEPVPGFSSLKPSKPFRKSVTVGDRKYTVPLDWYRAGEWFKVEQPEGGTLFWVDKFYQGVHAQRDRDFARGHAIHSAAEAALVGQGVLNVNADAAPYIPHLTEWIERNVTDVHAIEAVVFGDGYGGTGDAWVNVRGVSVYLDWKSRGADSAHGIYEEEIAQGGAYTSARYCILPSDDRERAVRAPLPAATYGLVLSLRPDGVEEFWYDLEAARASFAMMKQAHTMTSASGKLARAAKAKDPTTVQESAKRKRKDAPAPAPSAPPDEGLDATEEQVAPVRARYLACETGKRWIGELERDAMRGHCGFHLTTAKTIRRLRIVDGLLTLAEAEACDEDAVKALVRLATGDGAVEWPTVSAGVAVGSLGAVEAAAFVEACALFVAGRYRLLTDDGGPRVLAVAA